MGQGQLVCRCDDSASAGSSGSRIGVICIWMGPVLSYFPLWWRSAASNPDIDFHLLTDQKISLEAPNIFVHSTTIEDEERRYSDRLHRPVSISRPYKFCDYRPLYGILYEDMLAEYDFWGYCDLDMVFGSIRSFVTEEVLESYEILYRTGQLCLYRNVPEINGLWREGGSIYSLDEVFDPLTNCGFDERFGIMRIADKRGVRVFTSHDACGCDDVGFIETTKCLFAFRRKNYESQAFYWKDGRTFHRWCDEAGSLDEEEVFFLHFPGGRKLAYDEGCADAPVVMALETGFVPLNEPPDVLSLPKSAIPSAWRRRFLLLKKHWTKTRRSARANQKVFARRWMVAALERAGWSVE